MPLKIDCHMHIYESKRHGRWDEENYEVWEYGEKPGQKCSDYDGDIEDALDAMKRAGFDHAVAVNLFVVAMARELAVDALPAGLEGGDRERALADIDATMGDRLRAFNRWLCDTVAGLPITPYASVDPNVLSPDENVAHLRDLVANHGVRGIKLHPIVQRFAADDPRMLPIYEACIDLGIVVLTHTGPAKSGEKLGEPEAFVPVLQRYPDLKLVMAHMGGRAWRQTAAVAAAFPQLHFDLCEIVAWLGATAGPSLEDFGRLIAEVGPERVLLGTDFPWYDLDTTVGQVMAIPGLSTEQKEGILGANAARFMGVGR